MALFTDGSYVLSNLHDEEIDVTIEGKRRLIAAREFTAKWKK